jgi:hypothetical protein
MSAEFGQSPYDAASTTTDRDFGIFYGLASEDLSFTDNARFIAITRIRKEVRNNPYLAGLIAKLPEAIGSSSMRSRTGDRAYDIAKESWYYKISKKVTSAGLSMRAVESVLWPELAMCGEVFFIKLGNGRLQMQASEFCGGMRYNVINPDGSCVVNGIAYDRFGAPTAYRFGRKTSWGGISFTDADSTVIPADKVIHVFSPDRIEMGAVFLGCCRASRRPETLRDHALENKADQRYHRYQLRSRKSAGYNVRLVRAVWDALVQRS